MKVPFTEIWDKLRESCSPAYESNGNLSDHKLTAPDGRVISTHWAGKLIKEQLFGKPAKWKNGTQSMRGYIWSINDLKLLGQFMGTDGTDGTDLEGYMEGKKADLGDSSNAHEREKQADQNIAQNIAQNPLKTVPSVADQATNDHVQGEPQPPNLASDQKPAQSAISLGADQPKNQLGENDNNPEWLEVRKSYSGENIYYCNKCDALIKDPEGHEEVHKKMNELRERLPDFDIAFNGVAIQIICKKCHEICLSEEEAHRHRKMHEGGIHA